MDRRTGFFVLVVMLIACAAVAQEAAPTAVPAAPAPQATPAAPPAPAAAAPAPSAAPAPAAAAPAPVTVQRIYFEKAEVVVDGKADYNGAVELEWKPLNGEGKLIQVNVLAKSKDKDIAADIYKELTLAAGGTYKVKQNGEKVRVEKTNKKVPNFAITITKLQLPGVSLRVEKR